MASSAQCPTPCAASAATRISAARDANADVRHCQSIHDDAVSSSWSRLGKPKPGRDPSRGSRSQRAMVNVESETIARTMHCQDARTMPGCKGWRRRCATTRGWTAIPIPRDANIARLAVEPSAKQAAEVRKFPSKRRRWRQREPRIEATPRRRCIHLRFGRINASCDTRRSKRATVRSMRRQRALFRCSLGAKETALPEVPTRAVAIVLPRATQVRSRRRWVGNGRSRRRLPIMESNACATIHAASTPPRQN